MASDIKPEKPNYWICPNCGEKVTTVAHICAQDIKPALRHSTLVEYALGDWMKK